MPLAARKDYQLPDFWTVFGHSYMAYAYGTYYQTGRADSALRASLDIEHANWQNYAIAGSKITGQGRSLGGHSMVLQHANRPQRAGPYSADGGTALLCWGINDLGFVGITSQIQTAWEQVLRTCISRWRASVIFENDYQIGTRVSYGAGFTSSAGTQEFTSGTTYHHATATTNANFTLTLPSDYNGETVAICFVGQPGVTGGTVTFSGTAGVTGTISTSNILPSAAFSHCPIVKRITNLTSANAGQTIIGTVTAIDASGDVGFDCWWLEALEPQPVIVCNIARLTPTGYAIYPGWTGTEAQQDQNVVDWNTSQRTVVAEFDSMVQIADMDGAIGKSTSYLWSDGLHPNEKGAARIADAIREACRRLVPTAGSPTTNINPSAPRAGPSLRPHISGQWYTADYDLASDTTFTVTTSAAAGSLFAIPIWVTQPREYWTRFAMRTGTTGGSASTIRWGLYNDIGWNGYPQELINEATSGGTLSTGTAASTVIMSPTSGAGSISLVMDPGLYWLALMSVTAGATQTWTSLTGCNQVMPNVASSGAPLTSVAAQLNSYKLTGQATTALPTTFPTGGVATANPPYMGVQVSINPTN